MRSLFAISFAGIIACGGSSKPASSDTAAATTPADGHRAHKGHKEHSGVHHPIGHRFENAEEWAERFDNPERDAWQKPATVVGLMEIKAGMTVADIGAGTGYFLPHLSQAVGEAGSVLGLDVEPDMVRYMEARVVREGLANVNARKVATADPELSLDSMDRILIVDTWHHVANRGTYAQKLAASLRPGGAVFIVDFTMETEKGPHKNHRLTSDSIVAELTAAGLQTELLEEDLPDQFIVRGSRP